MKSDLNDAGEIKIEMPALPSRQILPLDFEFAAKRLQQRDRFLQRKALVAAPVRYGMIMNNPSFNINKEHYESAGINGL